MGRRLTNSQQALLTDKQIDTLPKAAGQPVFSTTGKPPGNNHGKSGGNLLFCDGHVEPIPPNTPIPLDLSTNEVLLNP
jgi:prepilin-type processing-associated H-X9-DG protein